MLLTSCKKLINQIKSYFKVIYNKGGFHIALGQFMTKFVTFFGSIFLVRLLSKEDYGILGYYENIYNYAFLIAGLGLSNAVLRYIVLAEDNVKKGTYFSFIVKRSFVIDFLICLFGLLVNLIYPHPDVYSPYKSIFSIYIFSLPFQDITQICLYNERALFSNKRFAYFSFFLSSSLIIFKVVGARFFEIEGALLSTLLSYFMWFLFLYFSEHKNYYKSVSVCSLSKSEKKNIMSYSYQYMLTNGLWIMFSLNDTFLLGRLIPSATIIADYRVVHSLPANISIFSTAIGMVVTPYFVKHENDLKWVKENFSRVLFFSSILVGGVCGIMAVLSKPLIHLLFGEAYVNTAPLMALMCIPVFLNSAIRYVIANIYAAMGKIRLNLLCSLLGVIIQIGLDYLLIPQYEILGVIVSNTLAYLLMTIVLVISFRKNYS